MWRGCSRATYARTHSQLSICDQTPPSPSLPPFSWPVAALLSSERRLGKCRTSSAELSLHSCWCQLLCPPSLLSPSPPLWSPSHKLAAATCWLLLNKKKKKKQAPFPSSSPIDADFDYPDGSVVMHHLQVSGCCANSTLCYVTGTPTLTATIIIPSCSSRPCWLATSRSHRTRRSMWEWHM